MRQDHTKVDKMEIGNYELKYSFCWPTTKQLTTLCLQLPLEPTAWVTDNAAAPIRGWGLTPASFLFHFQPFSDALLWVEQWTVIQEKCPKEPETRKIAVHNVGPQVCKDPFGGTSWKSSHINVNCHGSLVTRLLSLDVITVTVADPEFVDSGGIAAAGSSLSRWSRILNLHADPESTLHYSTEGDDAHKHLHLRHSLDAVATGCTLNRVPTEADVKV